MNMSVNVSRRVSVLVLIAAFVIAVIGILLACPANAWAASEVGLAGAVSTMDAGSPVNFEAVDVVVYDKIVSSDDADDDDGDGDDGDDDGDDDDDDADDDGDDGDDADGDDLEYIIEEKMYTGSQIKPEVKVAIRNADGTLTELRLNTDYTIAYGPNTEIGDETGTITITGIGAYTGVHTETFGIKYSIADIKVSKIASQTYTGKSIKPKPTVKLNGKTLKLNADYRLVYKNNKNAGKATVTIKGAGTYGGSEKVTFTIKKAAISKAKVASIGKKKATGKALKPKPTVKFGGKKLKLNRDYKLSYKNNKKAGTATVIVKGKGNFKGTTKKTFQIV